MLYLTTRDNTDAYTAYKALTQDNGPDGGQFVPFRLPKMTSEQIVALKEKSFGEIVAYIINQFFSLRLTGWDVDCCIGRNPIKLISMNHKILVAELWHNLEGQYTGFVTSLYKITNANTDRVPTDWFHIAARIAILFGIYGEMVKNQCIADDDCFDISVPTGDFSAPMAAWYCRKMGLPINTIICTNKENSTVWDFVHRGTYNPITAKDDLNSGVERLIYAALGFDAVQSYLSKVESGRIYSVIDESFDHISTGFFCSVAGNTRADTVINSVFRTNQYAITPETALLFGGLQDFRAKVGDSRVTVILAESAPSDQ